MNYSVIGRYIIIAGIILVVVGLIVYFIGNRMSWLGHLPGDIRIIKPGFRFYFPITTMLLITAVINFIIWVVRKLF